MIRDHSTLREELVSQDAGIVTDSNIVVMICKDLGMEADGLVRSCGSIGMLFYQS
jgi:hypothetical protein